VVGNLYRIIANANWAEALPAAAKQQLRDEWDNSGPLSDGIIFKKIRQAQLRGDSSQERKWLARLSDPKRRDLRQMQRWEEFAGFRASLDALLDFNGLWPAKKMSIVRRLLTQRCPEVNPITTPTDLTG